MSKTLSRLVFGLWIVGAPLVMIGCSEGEKPVTATPETPKEGTPPAAAPGSEPASPAPAPATPPAEPAAPPK